MKNYIYFWSRKPAINSLLITKFLRVSSTVISKALLGGVSIEAAPPMSGIGVISRQKWNILAERYRQNLGCGCLLGLKRLASQIIQVHAAQSMTVDVQKL
jgi:hypothetical protein